MNGRQKGTGKMSKMTQFLYGNKKRAMGIALGIAGAAYVLAFIFGKGAVRYAILEVAFVALAAFGGMFLVTGFHLINPFSTPGFVDFIELFFGFAIAFGMLVWFVLFGLWQLFGEDALEAACMIAVSAGAWCALCQVHNIRK